MEPEVNEPAAIAAHAVELDDRDPWAHLALGWVAFTRRRTEEAVDEFQRALDLNPNFAAAHGYLGFALVLDGRSDQAIDHVEQAIRRVRTIRRMRYSMSLSAPPIILPGGTMRRSFVAARRCNSVSD